MNSRILGSTLPVLELMLEPNDSIVAVSGELSWMNRSIEMITTTRFGAGGGLFSVLKRVAGGGSFFLTQYTAVGEAGLVAFATKVPGQILQVDVGPGREYLTHRHGFLCATPGVSSQ